MSEHDWLDLPDLAAEAVGGAAILANDEFFAEKENLLKPGRAVFLPDEYTDRGKWMDGWETRRRRTPGHVWCTVRLGLPGVVHGVVVDTALLPPHAPSTPIAPRTSTPAVASALVIRFMGCLQSRQPCVHRPFPRPLERARLMLDPARHRRFRRER